MEEQRIVNEINWKIKPDTYYLTGESKLEAVAVCLTFSDSFVWPWYIIQSLYVCQLLQYEPVSSGDHRVSQRVYKENPDNTVWPDLHRAEECSTTISVF